MKRVAVALVIVLVAFLVWIPFQASHVSIVVDGQTLRGTGKLAAEGWGLLVALVAVFCAAMLLLFVFAGIGLILLGALVLVAFVAAWIEFPFLLPLLLPLLIVWLFVAIARGRGG